MSDSRGSVVALVYRWAVQRWDRLTQRAARRELRRRHVNYEVPS